MQPHPYGPLQEPTPGKPPRKVPRVAIAAGMTAFFGLAGAGLAFATSGGGAPAASLSSTSSSTTTSVPKQLLPRAGKPGGPMFGLGPVGLGRVLHGQYTIDQGGTYKTVAEQTGQVASTDAKGTSITVTSSDGFSQTYVVNSSTVVDSLAGGIRSVQKGDTVSVQAVVQGTTLTATNIVDGSKIGSSRKSFGLVPPRGQGQAGSARVRPPGPATPQP